MKQETIVALRETRNVLNLFSGLQRAASEMHFPLVAFALRISSQNGPDHFSLSNYPDVWRHKYNQRNYIAKDPVLRQSLLSLSAVFWDELDLKGEDDLAFMREAAKHGLCHGFTLPLYGPDGEIGILSLARQTPLPADQQPREQMRIHGTTLAWTTFDTTMELLRRRSRSMSLLDLTRQEVECLNSASLGDMEDQIERDSTRAYLIMSAIRKLGVQSGAEARTAASAMGLLSSDENSPDIMENQTPRQLH